MCKKQIFDKPLNRIEYSSLFATLKNLLTSLNGDYEEGRIDIFKSFIESLFDILFCQDKKTKYSSKIVRDEKKECVDSNDFESQGGLFEERSSADNSRRQSKQSNLNSNIKIPLKAPKLSLFKQQHDHKEDISGKNLFECCYETALCIMIKLLDGSQHQGPYQFNYEIAKHIIATFVKHLRLHMHQSTKGFCCFQSAHAMLMLFQNSGEIMYEVAKQKDTINFLFNMMPYLFKEESRSIAQRLNGGQPSFNLNSLIIGQGFQGQQINQSINLSQQIGQGNQSNKVAPSTVNPSQRSPVSNQHKKEERKGKAFLNKLAFTRAASEPPSAGKNNSVLPVTEDYDDDAESREDLNNRNIIRLGTLEQVEEEEIKEKGTKRKSSGLIGEKQIPPLKINEITQSSHNQLLTPNNVINTDHNLQPQQVLNSSSLVMTSYLNMPLGLFSTTMNHLSSNSRQGEAASAGGPNFKLNFVPQTTIAKSRLTRRQLSMSRKHTQKFSSVSNFGQGGVYGEDAGSREQPSRRLQQQDYSSVDRFSSNANGEKSTSQQRKGPPVPKLNINQIVYDNTNQVQRIDTTGYQPNGTAHQLNVAQLTTNNAIKSSNRSNAYSNQNFENHLHAAQKIGGNAQVNANPYQQPGANPFRPSITQGIFQNESERNYSLYDDINGSFIDDVGLHEPGQHNDGTGYQFDNAEEKLRQLAIQLGESCLTNDLAALISQKREIELAKSARKSVSSMMGHGGSKTSKSTQQKAPQRSVSVSYYQEPFFNRGDSCNDSRRLDIQVSVEQVNQEQHDSLRMKTRQVILNLEYSILKKYDVGETRFLKHPITALNAFIQSKQFKAQRKHNEIEVLELGNLQLKGNKAIMDSNGEVITDLERGKKAIIGLGQQDNQNVNDIIQNFKLNLPKVDNESTIIFKIYQKFTFVNEEIIRNQVQNELSNFASKERGLYGNTLPFQSRIQNNSSSISGNQVPNLMLPIPGIPSSTQIFRPQPNSYSRDSDSSITISSQDTKSSIGNPNIMWSSNGIGYDFSTTTGSSSKSTAQTTFQKERIRKKLDVLLYSIDRRIKNLIQKQYTSHNSLEALDITFAKGLKCELTTLNAYLESQKSRIMLYQVIEVVLESLVMIKKTLTDLALKTSIYVIDFSKHQHNFSPDPHSTGKIYSGGYISRTATGKNQLQHTKSPSSMGKIGSGINRFQMVKTQKAYRSLFAEYLSTLSILLSLTPGGSQINSNSQETMKLLTEVFIAGDESWQESVKTYVISLFLSDISSSIQLSKINESHRENKQGQSISQQASLLIEELRGINLVNLDEQLFLSTVAQTAQALLQVDQVIAIDQVKKSMYHYLLCANHVMSYFQSVLQFFQKAIAIHFQHRYGNHKSKQGNSGGSGTNNLDGLDSTHSKDLASKLEGRVNGGTNEARRGSTMDQQASSQQVNNDDQSPKQQKYWKQIIRRILYQCMYLITPPNGLLSSYLQTNAINFVNFSTSASTNRLNITGRGPSARVSPMRQTSFNFTQFSGQTSDNELIRNGLCPLNFQLTVSSLSFLRLVFDLPEKFTKYAFIQEELMLFYIRTHYISFVRLYNKNFSKKESSTSQRAIEAKQRSMTLCRSHLECLFAIARNRSEDTRRKLYQFKILQFLCQEIELEFECTTNANKQKRSRLLMEAKQASQIEEESSMKVVENDQFQEEKIEDVSQRVIEAPKRSLPMGLTKLNLTGLAPPSILLGPQPIQEEAKQEQPKVEQIISNRQQEQLQAPPKKKFPGFGIPKLNIGGLGLSEIIPESVGTGTKTQLEIDQLRQLAEEQKKKLEQASNRSKKTEESKRDFVQPKPFIPKLLGVEKLGLTGIIKEDSQRLQTANMTDQTQDQITQPQRISFNIPKLAVAGLGFTDLKQDDQCIIQPLQSQDQVQHTTVKKHPLLLPIPQANDSDKTDANETHMAQQPPTEISIDESVPQIPQKKPRFVPTLNITGLTLSEIVKEEPPLNIKPLEEQKKDVPMGAPVKKGLPFMPKLNVGGLGHSEIIQGTQEKPIQTQQEAITAIVEEEKRQESIVPPPQKKLPFGMPKLNITGLTLSELTQDIAQPIKVQDMQTINPNGGLSIDQTIDYSGYLDAKVVVAAASVTHEDDKLFHNRQSQRDKFENTAPAKIANHFDEKLNSAQGASAPQENRMIKGVFTRNEGQELSVKESLESAQYIKFVHKGHNSENPSTQLIPSERKQNLMDQKSIFLRPSEVESIIKVRDSYQSNATQLRVESIIDGGASLAANSFAPSPLPFKGERTVPMFNQEKLLTTQTPNVLANSGRSLVGEQEEGPKSTLKIQLNLAQIQPPVKKPLVPSLKIPAKQEQLEGKDKIQQQIEYSKQLNEKVEAGDLTKLQNQLNKNNVKFQVLIDNHKSNKTLHVPGESSDNDRMNDKREVLTLNDQEVYYQKETSMRPIYQDEELHSLMLSLIVCLLLTPERGTLDELYCSQYPIDNGKQNVLFLLHHHMNHPRKNQRSLIHSVLTRVHREVNPPLAGLRLLKLLCTSLFDLSLYNNGQEWKKIAEGAYAKVYESKTNLAEPQAVAIKHLLLPNSIYDRCVLHDIFTEITCLEELRLEPCVSDLYDYGVDNNSYYIVMKRYTCSLRQWRLQQQKGLNENLSLYLSIYKEFLKSLLTIHSHNVTHYDIKCDNVLLDLNTLGNSNSLSQQFISATDNDDENGSKIKLTIGDFGECKIFSSEKDELCQRNRGTDYCKSPEMLQLTINTRKDTDKYDRRKQVGTNRLSDVWSAGCLLYELLTGDFLFYSPDYLQFHFRVTRPSEALFTPDKFDKINNNVYLIDFMKYMLVRDPRLRPSIENVLKRFEHVHALLVSTTGGASITNYRMSMGHYSDSNSNSFVQGRGTNISGGSGAGFESILEQASQIMLQSNPDEQQQTVEPDREREAFFIKIMEDVSLCNYTWFKKFANSTTDPNSLNNQSVTHLIYQSDLKQKSKLINIEDNYDVLLIQQIFGFPDGSKLTPSSFLLFPKVLDFLRKVAVNRGKVLFIEDDVTNSNCKNQIRECLLLCLTHIFQTNAYETYTLIRSQNLFFKLLIGVNTSSKTLAMISQFNQNSAKISSYLSTYPRFSCRCGSCVIILKRQYANYSNMETVTCNCSQYYRNVDNSQCPSPGCNEFIQFMKTYFKVQQLDNLHWGFVETDEKTSDKDPFVVGPRYLGNLHHKAKHTPQREMRNMKAPSYVERMIASNMSQTIDLNSTLVSVSEKKSTVGLGHQGSRKAGTMYDHAASQTSKWKLFKCKECHVWTHATNEAESRFAILLNNRIKDVGSRNHYVNIKSLNAKQYIENGQSLNVRVPILQKIKLNLPF